MSRAFVPYSSSQTASGPQLQYPSIYYLGRTALISFHRPSKHWPEVENGTIGAADFPQYTLRALDQNVQGAPLVDGFKVRDGRLSVLVNGTGFTPTWTAYKADGSALWKDDSQAAVQLEGTGKQWVGIEVGDGGTGAWVGFNWVEVEALGPSAPDCGPVSCTDYCAAQPGMEGGFCLTNGTCECTCKISDDTGAQACKAQCGNPDAVCAAFGIPWYCPQTVSDANNCLCSCDDGQPNP